MARGELRKPERPPEQPPGEQQRQQTEIHPATLAARRLLADASVNLLLGHLGSVNTDIALNFEDSDNPGKAAVMREQARLRVLALEALVDTIRRYGRGEFADQEIAALDVLYQRTASAQAH